MSIGDSLTQARRQSGLTLAQISQRTCIRETIIKGLERGDYSACGGDFYARGHIRSVAQAVGLDPEPLVSEYDAAHTQRQAMTAADVFEPSTPLKFSERRHFNWSIALAVALVLVAGLATYKLVIARPAASGAAPHRPAAAHRAAQHRAVPAADSRLRLVIHLTATRACWVQLTTSAGRTIYRGTVAAGQAMSWVERQRVRLVLGNPAGVALTVNGKNPVPAGTANALTLSLLPSRLRS